jgi:Na+-translocating ferredoxin:NAD+ oxidoreductase RnfG subunit
MNNNNKILKYTVFLLLLGIIAGALLGAVNAITSPIIKERKEKEATEALQKEFNYARYSASMIGDIPADSEVIIDFFYTYDSSNNKVSVIFKTVSQGYKSEVTAYVEVMVDGKFGKVMMIDHNDTESYAQKVVGHDFGVTGSKTDSFNPISAGASFTSQAVIDGIYAAAKHFEVIKQKGGLAND